MFSGSRRWLFFTGNQYTGKKWFIFLFAAPKVPGNAAVKICISKLLITLNLAALWLLLK
jgi:hypothetical protein